MRNNPIKRYLTLSLIGISLLCVVVFSILIASMNQRSEEAISEVGLTYMNSMNARISKHFSTMMELRLSQLETLADAIPLDSIRNEDPLRQWLIYSAQARGFDSLAYLYSDGSIEMIYGEQVAPTTPAPFLASLQAGEKKISSGTDAEGNSLVLLGVPCSINIDGKAECIALVGDLPISSISDTLSLESEDSLVYSFVIRQDGSFVIRSFDAYRNNYFERVRAIYEELDGKGAEDYIAELQAAMAAQEDYSAMIYMYGGRRHLYCTSLPLTEWYLVTIMPYGTINEVVGHLSMQSLYLAIGSCLAILVALLFIFLRYFHMNSVQMETLQKSEQAAKDANRAKGEFLSNMSHDIRTPMNAIVGMTTIALANLDNPQQVQGCLKKISLSSKHLLGLINDVLDMSKIESGKMTLNMEQVSLREVMESIVSIVQPQIKAKEQHFTVSIHDISTENVRCDSVRLNQVLLNLLSNAIKFTPEGGAVDLAVYEEPSSKGSGYIRIHLLVRDTGIGMSEEFMDHIFESFVREDNTRVHKTEGTGLGMAITKYIVDAMGGEISVTSHLGQGSEFHVVLDFEKSQEQEEEMHLPPWRMLVVDDDQQLCESTVFSLQSIGICTDWALDGETAVRMVDEHHQAQEDYQVILLDWKLPGMDGIKTAKEIRLHLGNDVPILLISAYDWTDIEEEARAAGVTGFLSKPLFRSTLYYGLKRFANNEGELVRPEEKPIDFTGKRVLLAEDNELNWEVASELLQDLGLELDWAENGQICVDKFQQHPEGYYDAVLMDIRMPVMNGYEATKAIRATQRLDANLPIVAMTADAFSEDIQRCLDCGMNAHIAKPIDIKETSRLLARMMAGKA